MLAFSPDQPVLNFGSTDADASPAHAAPPSLVPYTSRPFGHQRRYTNRLTVDKTAWVARERAVDAAVNATSI